MVSDAFPMGLVRQPFADLGQIVLTSGMVNGGSEFSPLACQMTAPAE
jgi:hypothetical protein